MSRQYATVTRRPMSATTAGQQSRKRRRHREATATPAVTAAAPSEHGRRRTIRCSSWHTTAPPISHVTMSDYTIAAASCPPSPAEGYRLGPWPVGIPLSVINNNNTEQWPLYRRRYHSRRQYEECSSIIVVYIHEWKNRRLASSGI
jgi:hypothetical protein